MLDIDDHQEFDNELNALSIEEKIKILYDKNGKKSDESVCERIITKENDTKFFTILCNFFKKIENAEVRI